MAINSNAQVVTGEQPFPGAKDGVIIYNVVTGERPSGTIAKPNIPDVCGVLGIPCMNVLAMFRSEGWKA